MNKLFFSLLMIVSLCLEKELVPATITVTNPANIGSFTLREAVRTAIAGDTITFNIPSPGVITLESALPPLALGSSSRPITIDGTTQPGGAQIIMNSAVPATAFTLSSYNIIKGLSINGANNAIVAGSNNQITGCFIGTNPAGTTTNPNVTGIVLNGTSNSVTNCTISGNTTGIVINANSTSNTISGNALGTSSTGTALGNTSFALTLLGSSNTIMGNTISFSKTSAGVNVASNNNTFTGNTIDSHNGPGIMITGSSNTLSGNSIENNGGAGIFINTTSAGGGSLNIIGTSTSGNTITGNQGAGVVIGGSLTTNAVGNQISSNSIYTNKLLGIDLGNQGVPLPPQTNPSQGPNHLQNAPVLTSAQLACSGQVTVTFSLQSSPSTQYTVQFYKNSTNRNLQTPSITEGEAALGSQTIMTNTAGSFSGSYTFTPTNTVLPTDFISATATNSSTSDTSEFSTNVSIASSGPTVTITASSLIVCSGTSLTLSANVSGGTYPFTYLWSTGATTQSITVTPTATTTYMVTITDAKGCQTSGSQAITVDPAPSVSLSASATAVCAGNSVQLIASPNTLSSYQFFANGSAISTVQTSPTFMTTPTGSSTSYTVRGTDSSGCIGTSSPVTVMVSAIPQPTLNVSTQSPCMGSAITLTAFPAGLSSYQFFANGQPLGGQQTSPTFETTPAQGTTSYTVLAVSNGCQGISAPITVTPIECTTLSVTNCCSKSIFPCDTVTFTVTVQNTGYIPAVNVVVTDTLPSCMKFKKATGANWTISKSGQNITATLPSLAPWQKASFTVTLTASCCAFRGQSLANTVTAQSDTSNSVSATAIFKVVT